MDIKTAATVARQMSQFFRAFKEVEEVLDAAAHADNLQGEIEDHIKNLIDQREQLAKDLDHAQNNFAKVKKSFQEQLQKQAEEQNERLESFSRELEQKQREAGEQLASVTKDLEGARKAHFEFVTAAAQEREGIEKDLKGLMRQLEQLKSKVASL